MDYRWNGNSGWNHSVYCSILDRHESTEQSHRHTDCDDFDIFLWLGILAVTDIKRKIIPNKILVLLLLFWTAGVSMLLILQTEFGLTILFESLAGGTIGGIIFLLCYLLSKGQLGAGDVKLVFVMGLYLTGERIIGAVFYGTLICCVYSVLLLIRKKITRKDGVPMTPFLYLGTIITYIIM